MRMYWLFLTLLLEVRTEATVTGQHSLEDVYNLLSRIDDNLRKEDRMREITRIVQIDVTLKNIEKRLNDIGDKLEDNDLGRGISFDLRSDLQVISQKIEKMEDTSNSLQTIILKMDEELKKLEEVERIMNQLERDLEHRLTKLMNAISSLHEMNKGLSNHLRIGNGEVDRNALSSESVTYVMDALEDMERKIKEELSVLKVQLRKDLDSLRIVMTNALVQCESNEDNDEYNQPDYKRSEKASNEQFDHFDVLARNLSRSQREIKEEFHSGMQGLEKKIEDLTANCVGESRNSVLTTEAPPAKCVADQFVRDATSCADLRRSGTTCDGIYFVYHPSGRAIRIYCDMSTDGGGWTVIMRRGDYGSAPLSFHLPWRLYKHGFGNMNEEFWLGNDNIHLLTTGNETNQLRIELESFDRGSRNFAYNSFSIDNENNEYRMRVKQPVDGRSNIFLHYSDRPFVTYDRITDQPGDCAQKYKGGWWYRRNCIYTVLTGQRFDNGTRISMVGMQSQLWREAGILKAAEMKIRPRNFHV